MRGLFILALAAFYFLVQPLRAQSEPQPNYSLAYILATASYCSYAVNELEGDRGQTRAQRCLKAAAGVDSRRLDAVDVTPNDVEAYYDPDNTENAYLLVRAKNGVILAFRGTLTPPIDPDGNIYNVSKETITAYNVKVGNGFMAFAHDWLNDARAGGDSFGRHRGFDDAWHGLLKHLRGEDCQTPPKKECSKFNSLIAGLDKTKGEKLYITGHSKGGALATLAALDIPQNFAGIVPVVNTFSAAKSLTAKSAEDVVSKTGGIWRFERADDIVPDVPPDRSVLLWTALGAPAYAHVGALALFDGTPTPKLSFQAADGVYQPDDDARISKFLKNVAGTILINPIGGDITETIANIFNAGEAPCRKFVDSHFAVLSDVRSLAGAGDSAGPSLFIAPLTDKQGKVLWGYSNWCDLLKFAQ